MLIICGALVNGPYALITTAVSADLVSGLPPWGRGRLWGLGQGLGAPDPFLNIPTPSQCTEILAYEIFKVLQNLPSAPGLFSQLQAQLLPFPKLAPLPALVLPGAASPFGPPRSILILSPQGTHQSLKGNAKALSTVTAIIDGTGSIGL